MIPAIPHHHRWRKAKKGFVISWSSLSTLARATARVSASQAKTQARAIENRTAFLPCFINCAPFCELARPLICDKKRVQYIV